MIVNDSYDMQRKSKTCFAFVDLFKAGSHDGKKCTFQICTPEVQYHRLSSVQSHQF